MTAPRPRVEGEAVTHRLKTWPSYFNAVASGRKTFEWRKNDRDFREGDTLLLVEWNPDTKEETGRAITRTVSYVLENRSDDPRIGFGMPRGYVVLGFDESPVFKERLTALTAEVERLTKAVKLHADGLERADLGYFAQSLRASLPTPAPEANGTPHCPSCGTRLSPVLQTTGSLNDEQWESAKAGDWYCAKAGCTGGRPGGRIGHRYFWKHELSAPPAPEATDG